MARLRKDQAEELMAALGSAMSGPIEEITLLRSQLSTALRVVLDRPAADWNDLVHAAAAVDGWDTERRSLG